MPPRAAPVSDEASSDDGFDDSLLPVLVKLTKYQVTKSKTPTGKTTSKETKKVVTKTFKHKFESSEDNYHEFLEKILDAFDITGLFVGKKSVFRLKLQVPPAKQDAACDIEKAKEYLTAVTAKITDAVISKDIVAFIDMKDITSGLKKKKSAQSQGRDSDEESGSDDDSGGKAGSDEDVDGNGLTKLDKEMALLRGLLEKEHGNNENNVLSYTDPFSGDEIILSTGMLKEWTRALYDCKATLKIPPATPNFDARNKAKLIKQKSRVISGVPSKDSSRSLTPLTSGSDSPHAPPPDSAVIQTLGILNSTIGLLGHAFSSGALPSTPAQRHVAAPLSPLANTPSKLERFLKYCKEKRSLSAAGSNDWKTALEAHGYGPDIMQLVPHSTLVQLLSISPGDAIRFSKAAEEWWELESKGPRKRTATNASLGDGGRASEDEHPMAFEKRYLDEDGKFDGGKTRVYGTGLEMGEMQPDLDYVWFYQLRDDAEFIPIPRGMLPVLGVPDFDIGGSPDRLRAF